MVNHYWDGKHPARTACADDVFHAYAPDTVPHISVGHWDIVSCPDCEAKRPLVINGLEIHDWQLEHMAFAMFTRNMEDYEFEPGTEHIAWLDEGVAEFWRGQARAVLADFDRIVTPSTRLTSQPE